MMNSNTYLGWGDALARLACCAVMVMSLASCGDREPQSQGGPPTLRRLTQEQYKTIIADTFGADIKVQGRFDPDVRQSGLLAIGTAHVSVTPTNLEQYDTLARNIAAQVLDPQHRRIFVGCHPVSDTAPDDTCAGSFFSTVGRQLFRRPLTAAELNVQVRVAAEATKRLGNFYSGLETSLATMLESPRFLFREEIVSTRPDSSGVRYLDAYSKASRLSFFLWNTSPDDELLAAAADGDLDRRRGLQRQVDRMLKSPQLKDGVRAFFSDMLGFDTVDTLTKDTEIYPKFTPVLAKQAVEQTLRTITDHLVDRDGDYRDLFTTRQTFLSPLLASIYAVPIGTRSGWEPFEFPKDDPHAGITTQISFLAFHSHPGRSSPTLRGKAVREIFLCQPVPTPPANVNFAIVQDTKNANLPTARERLTAHRTQPTCAGCHKIIDPIGLSLEKFDGLGAHREQENGAQIDTDGQFDAVAFKGATGLGQTLHDAPATTACLVNRMYGYSTGRAPVKGDAEWIRYLLDRFAADGYRVPDLMRNIAMSNAFYKVSAAADSAAQHEANATLRVPSYPENKS